MTNILRSITRFREGNSVKTSMVRKVSKHSCLPRRIRLEVIVREPGGPPSPPPPHTPPSSLPSSPLRNLPLWGTSEVVFGTPCGTFWDHSGRFLGWGGGEGGLVHGGSSWLPDYYRDDNPHVGQVVRRPPRERQTWVRYTLVGSFSRSCHTSD